MSNFEDQPSVCIQLSIPVLDHFLPCDLYLCYSSNESQTNIHKGQRGSFSIVTVSFLYITGTSENIRRCLSQVDSYSCCIQESIEWLWDPSLWALANCSISQQIAIQKSDLLPQLQSGKTLWYWESMNTRDTARTEKQTNLQLPCMDGHSTTVLLTGKIDSDKLV